MANEARGQQTLRYVETAGGVRSASARDITQWTHARLVFRKDLERVAVGHDSILQVELLSAREVLLLGKRVGRTSLIAWFADGTNEGYVFMVNADLSVLRGALRDIHPDLKLESAPDRTALILRGTVPDVSYKIAADNAARAYLAAGMAGASLMTPLIKAEQPGADGNPPAPMPGDEPRIRPNGDGLAPSSDIAIINLIQVLELPMTTEQKIADAIQDVGGQDVTVRRILRGELPDDKADTLILEGPVANQVALVRIISIASRIFLGNDAGNDIKVIANEAGGILANRERSQSLSLNNIIGSGAHSGLGANDLDNEIAANLGRSKLLSVGNGRLLSVLEVVDVPQVRIAVQLYEVNRSRLKNWRPNVAASTSEFRPQSFNVNDQRLNLQPDAAQRIGSDGTNVEDAFNILRGAFTNQFQVGNSHYAFDLLFSMLEQEGIARDVSRPNLTVLSGELAVFQAGGQVPVPVAFSPAFGGQEAAAVGVFSGVQLLPFGIQLAVRPLVGEDDTITLDVNPVIVDPDTQLTQEIVSATGTSTPTTAFRTRSIDTTARIRDGQAMVIGGLVSHDDNDSRAKTPGFSRVPLLGWLGKSVAKTQDDTELIIVVTPTIVRDQVAGVEIWEYPSFFELLDSSVMAVGRQGVRQ